MFDRLAASNTVYIDFNPLFSEVVHFFLFLVTEIFNSFVKEKRKREYITSNPLRNQARNSTHLCNNEL